MMLPSPRRALAHAALLAATCPFVHACTEVDGGAVEVSWVLRTAAGESRACEDVRIDEIAIWWAPEGAEADAARLETFACDAERGVTGFDLAAGRAALWLVPMCVDGAAASEGSYRAPPPIVRTITEGDVITLETQLIEVRVTDCGTFTPCICE